MSATHNDRSVRSALDEDDALDIIDSLEDDDFDDDELDDIESLFDDDPPQSSRSKVSAAPYMNPLSQPRAPIISKQGKETTQAPASGQDQGGSRIQFYRSLQGFLQAMSEAAPIYIGEKSRNPDATEGIIRQNVGSLCARHLNLVEKCLEINNANTQDIMLRYQRRTLAKNLAELYEHHSMDALEGLVDIARNWAAQSKDFENSGSDSGTGDGWLSVKLSLFTATLKYYDELEGMWCGHPQNEVMLELQRIAIALAKEVAFSWSKRSQVSDREGLFSNALPHCLKIAQISYNELVLSALGGHGYNALIDRPELPIFDASCEETDMGYLEEAQEDLKLRVHLMAGNYMRGVKAPELRQDDMLVWKNALLEEVDKALSSAWEEASTDLIEELEEMSQEEQDSYLEIHDVMDFSRFEVRAVERLSMLDRPGRLLRIDFSEVTSKAKKHLAWMWGVSDSLIAARKENLPGE
jgi:hypothetical protein